MLPGETILSGAPFPEGFTAFQVLHTPAGYYVGYADDEGPYCRETLYTQDNEEAIRWRNQINACVAILPGGEIVLDEDKLNEVAFLPFVRS